MKEHEEEEKEDSLKKETLDLSKLSKCKDYISKTTDPISKEDKDRMHDVSDLLSLVQREKNYINNAYGNTTNFQIIRYHF